MTLMRRSDNMWPSFPSIIDSLFSRDLMDWNNTNYSTTNTTLPAVNIRETKDDFVIEVAAPGMEKKDFNINLENDTLMISSEKQKEENRDDEGYSRREFSYQSFKRTFTLPQHLVEGEKIAAKYNDGILRITLPKKEEAKPKPARQIKIA